MYTVPRPLIMLFRALRPDVPWIPYDLDPLQPIAVQLVVTGPPTPPPVRFP